MNDIQHCYTEKSRKEVSRTDRQVESWFWSHFPFSSLGDSISFHVPVKGSSQPHCPAHTAIWLPQAGMQSGPEHSPQSPRGASQHRARSIWSLLLSTLGTSSATHLLSFSQFKTKCHQFGSPTCSLCVAQTSVLRWEPGAGQGQLDLLM